ncbi:hypothetical protein N0V85_005961 [Neurospora sp. IMI 360204]|nr:hypothetical protein N0V85_005961 [Neurospora sp. IMI 360204]
MHFSTLLTTLTTLGLATLTSAAALDTTTSASTSCTNSGLSSTCSASTSTTTSASDSTGPQSIEEYIKEKQAQIATENSNTNNSTMFYSCCSSMILWDTEKNVMLDAFTTEGETVEIQYD